MKQLKISIMLLLIFTVLTGLAYPLLITGMGVVLFPHKSGGSLIVTNGTVKGSELIGQYFARPEYFHGRPSAVNYDSALSGGSNLGPANKKLIESVKLRAASVRSEYGLNDTSIIPSDLIFASGSGLDPHISVDSAVLQCERIAAVRKIDKALLLSLVGKYSERQLPFYGKSFVNVLKLNMELDGMEVRK